MHWKSWISGVEADARGGVVMLLEEMIIEARDKILVQENY
jgi:hypothetical protein